MTRKNIVISSEYGSGARIIGQYVAEELGMKFYNEDAILTKVANELRIDENVLRNYDEKLLSFIFDDFTQMDGSTLDANVYAPMRIYQAMSSVILKTIEEGPCILMEGCADQIPNTTRQG